MASLEDFKFKKEVEIGYSNTGMFAQSSLFHIVCLMQDCGTEFFYHMDSDNLKQRKQNNIVWMVSKTRVNVFGKVNWMDKLEIETYLNVKKGCKIEITYIAKNMKGDKVFVGKQQSFPLNLETKRIVKVEDTLLPQDCLVYEDVLNEPFQKPKISFEDLDLKYTTQTKISEMDFSEHINNAHIVKYMLDSLEIEKQQTISNFQIFYLKECRPLTNIKVFAKEIDDEIFFKIENDKGEEISCASAKKKQV